MQTTRSLSRIVYRNQLGLAMLSGTFLRIFQQKRTSLFQTCAPFVLFRLGAYYELDCVSGHAQRLIGNRDSTTRHDWAVNRSS